MAKMIDLDSVDVSKLSKAVRKKLYSIAESAARYELRDRTALTSPSDTKRYLSHILGSREHEVFACLFLDNRNRVIKYEELFVGTLDGASVYSREVVKAALKYNSAACVFVHNHPSGVTEPSSADEAITRKLRDALNLIDIRCLDHIVVGKGAESVSLAERGLI